MKLPKVPIKLRDKRFRKLLEINNEFSLHMNSAALIAIGNVCDWYAAKYAKYVKEGER